MFVWKADFIKSERRIMSAIAELNETIVSLREAIANERSQVVTALQILQNKIADLTSALVPADLDLSSEIAAVEEAIIEVMGIVE